MAVWRNRIVAYGEADPAALMPHSQNWRLHPAAQRAALTGVLDEIGVVQNVLVNQRTGRLVDGHLRVDLAIRHKQASVPVTYVDLDDAEEAAILATLDPLAALADADTDKLGALLGQFNFESQAVNDMIEGLFAPTEDFSVDVEAEEAGEVAETPASQESSWPSINVRVPPSTLDLYNSLQDRLQGSDEGMKMVDLVNRAARTLK